MPNYTRDGNYDIDLGCSGAGWVGTFAGAVAATATDILDDGEPFGPVEVTTGADTEPATTITGTLTAADNHTLTIVSDDDARTVHRIPVHTILRFRA